MGLALPTCPRVGNRPPRKKKSCKSPGGMPGGGGGGRVAGQNVPCIFNM